MTESWREWAAHLLRHEAELVREWFVLAETAWALGIRQTSADLLLHQCRARLGRPVLNHTSSVLARMWRERFPARESLFRYRPSRLDGDTPDRDPRQPELFGAPA